MKIQTLSLEPYQFFLPNGQERSSILLHLTDEKGNCGSGEVAPLPRWSTETLEDSLEQIKAKQQEILAVDWTMDHWTRELTKLRLLPSVTFGLESALLSILQPLPKQYTVPVSALLAGSPQEIRAQAALRKEEGYTSAKLKVCNLSFEEAASLIHALKDQFHLRIDVNRAWKTEDSLQFFQQFPFHTFDYVEEPFANPRDLAKFPHPLAVDESFPKDLSLQELAAFPTLKALVYKPTIQGGMVNCLPLHTWATSREIALVLSSSFESPLGLSHITAMAHRLSLSTPVGIGLHPVSKKL